MAAIEDIQAKILQYLSSQKEGVHALQIASAIGHNRITVGKYLDVLKAEGLVHVRSIGQANLWSIQHTKKSKILIVDDEEAVLNLVKITLGEKEYDIFTAADGEQALQKIASHMPDLVVLDVMMPKKDGFSVCSLIKENMLTKNIVVILLSAKSETSDKIKGMQAGADYYLTKPFDPLELEALIRSKLQKQLSELEKHPITGFDQGQKVITELKKYTRYKKYTVSISGFEKYVECSGFKNGMNLIEMIGKLLHTFIKEKSGINSYIGHLSDSQFIIAVQNPINDIQKNLCAEYKSLLPFLLANNPHVSCKDELTLAIADY